jgi:hypothetical protein
MHPKKSRMISLLMLPAEQPSLRSPPPAIQLQRRYLQRTISTFFDDKLSFSDNEHHAEGSVGTAPNINLKIETTSGDIEVEQRQE